MDEIFCKSENCPNPARVRGLCPKHYERGRRGSRARTENNAPYPECSVSHCDVEAVSRKEGALCKPHYQKKYRGQDPEDYVLPETHPAKTAPQCEETKCERRATSGGKCDYHRLRAAKTREDKPCSFAGCEKPSAQTGLCQAHYEQRRLTGEMKPTQEYGKYVRGELRCPVPGCRKPQETRGLCASHLRMSREYQVSQEDLIRVWTNPKCSNPGCPETKRLHMDHNHTTGEFRALLCSGCNTALGMVKEDANRIRGLATYIERFQ